MKIPGSWFSSSSITPSKKLSRRRVLASLKVDKFVRERNIAVAVPSEKCLLLSILFLAGTTGLDLVLLIQSRRRPSSPSSYLKVPVIYALGCVLKRQRLTF